MHILSLIRQLLLLIRHVVQCSVYARAMHIDFGRVLYDYRYGSYIVEPGQYWSSSLVYLTSAVIETR